MDHLNIYIFFYSENCKRPQGAYRDHSVDSEWRVCPLRQRSHGTPVSLGRTWSGAWVSRPSNATAFNRKQTADSAIIGHGSWGLVDCMLNFSFGFLSNIFSLGIFLIWLSFVTLLFHWFLCRVVYCIYLFLVWTIICSWYFVYFFPHLCNVSVIRVPVLFIYLYLFHQSVYKVSRNLSSSPVTKSVIL